MANTLAHGFVLLERLLSQRVAQVGFERVFTAIQESFAYHSTQMDAWLAVMAFATTGYSKRFEDPAAGSLQPTTGMGTPLPSQFEGYYDVAFPMHFGTKGYGADRYVRPKMTVEEVNKFTVLMLQADAKSVKRALRDRLLDSVTYTYTDPEFGALSIKGLANGDTDTYVGLEGAAATANHYIAQAAAIADATNGLDTGRDLIRNYPSQQEGEVVCHAATNQLDAIKGLQDFVPVDDPRILRGTSADTIAAGFPADDIRGYGREIIGRAAECWIVDTPDIPSNYNHFRILGVNDAIAMRQHAEAESVGFQVNEYDVDGNTKAIQGYRAVGFGAMNRIAGVLLRTGNGSWAVPSGVLASRGLY